MSVANQPSATDLRPTSKRKPSRPSSVASSPRFSRDIWQQLAIVAGGCQAAAAIKRALAVLGLVYRADRAWVGRYNSARTHFSGAYDWVGPGIRSHLHDVQGASVNMILDAHRKFLRGEIVAISAVEGLPRQSRAMQAGLRREGNQSTLSAPLFRGKKLIGFFGFDYVRQSAMWTPAELEFLKPLGEYLAGLLHRTLAADAPPAAPHRVVFLREHGVERALPTAEIVFIKSDGDYSALRLADGRRHFELRSLRTWVTQLPADQFLRVHGSYLVNVTHFERLERSARWSLHLRGIAEPIPVGRAYRSQVRQRIGF